MPTAKKKSTPPSVSSASAAETNGPVGEVLTLAEAATYLRVSEEEIIDLVHSQELPGRFTGSEWRFLKCAIQHWLAAGSPSRQSRKAAQLALAGKYKGDPDLVRIAEEASRRRGRPSAEDQ